MPGPASTSQDRRRWLAFGVCLSASFMTLLDVSIVNVALPSLATGLHADSSDLQWISSGYALAFGLLLVPAGRLGDVRGRRRVFVAGLAMFTLASALCGLAPTTGWLVVARLLQGAAGGLVTPQVSAFIQEMFFGAERGRAFGLLGATIGLSTAIGPVTGGLLIWAFGTDEGWRAVFFVNVPVGLVALPLAMRLLPPGTGRRGHGSLDPVGVVLLGLGVVLVLLPLVEARTWSSDAAWLLLPVGAAVLAAFATWERHYSRGGHEPMADLSLFRVRSYGLGVSLGLAYFAGFTAIFFVTTIFLQEGRGFGPLAAGLALTPFALGSAVSAAVGGRLVTRTGRPLVLGGLLLVIAGLVGTAVVVRTWDGAGLAWAMLPFLLLAGLGSGFVISPNLTLSLSEVPIPRAGSAGGVLQTAQRIGGAAGIAAVGSVYFSRLAATRGDWGDALATALLLCAGIVTLALVIAATDVALSRHAGDRTPTPGPAAPAGVG